MKKAKILSCVAGGLCFLAVAILIFFSVFMWQVMLPAIGDEAEGWEGLSIVLIAIIWIVINIAFIPCALSDFIFGILHFALKKKKKMSVASAILGGLDFVAACGIFMVTFMTMQSFYWLVILLVPIFANFVLRIVCAVVCSKAEKANQISEPTQE